jgi:hypothetical protein
VARGELRDTICISVETDHWNAGAGECHRDRQADIAQADDGDAAPVRYRGHVISNSIAPCER